MNVEDSPLLCWLKQRRPEYFYRALEARQVAAKWLGYVPATFHHYTSHGIDHSDEIIVQISKLLFFDDDAERPALSGLSATEAYILAVAAFLHDAGMVTSDRERLSILQSEEWRSWRDSEAVAKRWLAISVFRDGEAPSDQSLRQYIADLQTRFLLAEFVRRQHHERSGRLVSNHHQSFAHFAFDQPDLVRAIAEVCAAHGLTHRELNVAARFPEERDIRGDKVNLKFLAIILRLGDLLDVRYDRACPLLLNAACPLPGESFAHWSQYQRIEHKNITPERIEIVAACENADEHRILRDWFNWIAEEVDEARRTMSSARRHSTWRPPIASVSGEVPTIVVKPLPDARYLPFDWRFELDLPTVFNRLVTDIYDAPLVFVRELIQNACDASRCKLLADMAAAGLPLPESTDCAPESWLARYPIRLRVAKEPVANSLSGQSEDRQTLEILDLGVGMDSEIIRDYLLQVGRSWYQSEEFRKQYAFVPTSRFGIGFLSVFGASEHVAVKTLRAGKEPIELLLTGPRSYIVTTRGSRTEVGTHISVRLREQLAPGALLEAVRSWCKMVEFPIVVQEADGSETTIRRESPENFIASETSKTDARTHFGIRYFPANQEGIRGGLFIFVVHDPDGEHWDYSSSQRELLRKSHPTQVVPDPPRNLVCFNGIAVPDPYRFGSALSVRVDLRMGGEFQTVARNAFRRSPTQAIMETRWTELLAEHLRQTSPAKIGDEWRYKQRLARTYDLEDFWRNFPNTIPIRRTGILNLCSFYEVAKLESVYLISDRGFHETRDHESESSAIEGVTILVSDIEELSPDHGDNLLKGRFIDTISVRSNSVITKWSLGEADQIALKYPRAPVLMLSAQFCSFDDDQVAILRVRYARHRFFLFLNRKNVLVDWLIRVRSEQKAHHDSFARLASAFLAAGAGEGSKEGLVQFIDRCRDLPEFCGELLPRNLVLEWTELGLCATKAGSRSRSLERGLRPRRPRVRR